jgi:HD-GYP domain-containing protein (c-di-GMP phosphodiesterase class II)
MDISQFQDFLMSLASLSQWHFEVWQGREPLVSTAEGLPKSAERRALASRVMQGGVFQQIDARSGGCLAGAPLSLDGKRRGALIAWGNGSRANSPADAGIIEHVLERLTEVLQDGWDARRESEKLTEELARNFEHLYLYARISGQVKTLRFSDDTFVALIGDMLETMRADMAFVCLEGRRGNARRLIHDNRVPDRITDVPGFVDRLIAAIPDNAASLQEHYFVVNDSRKVPLYKELHPQSFRALMVAIRNSEKFYGWFAVVSFNMKEIFRLSEMRLCVSITEQVAVVITNSDLYDDLEQFAIGTVKSLVCAIEAKDFYTRGHSERVNRYCMLMAERLALTEDRRNHLYWASILHDVGKIAIPEGILNKPGRLTEEEYAVIKSHPARGCDILKPLVPLAGSLPGILHHHERYEGGGYPDGIHGEEIPLVSRIVAVADTFDAVTSDRAYRLGMTPREALALLKSVAGTQLDPDIVRLHADCVGRADGIGGKERMAG